MVAESISVVGLFLDGSTVGQIQTQIFFFSFFKFGDLGKSHNLSVSVTSSVKWGEHLFTGWLWRCNMTCICPWPITRKSFSFRSVLEGLLSLSTQHALHGGLWFNTWGLPGSPATLPENVGATHPLRLWEDHPYFRALPTNVGEAGDCNPCISRVRSQLQVRGHGRGGVHSSPLPS